MCESEAPDCSEDLNSLLLPVCVNDLGAKGSLHVSFKLATSSQLIYSLLQIVVAQLINLRWAKHAEYVPKLVDLVGGQLVSRIEALERNTMKPKFHTA